MKLYIATCTLNFNNILSTESISPLGFYSKRKFGNKRFYPVCANAREEAILLYSKYPRYNVEDSDLENYPMVIEIESEDYKVGYFEMVTECDGVEVFACYRTVNLNPFHSKFYFGSNSERQSVLSKAEQSLENKFYLLYKPNLEVKPKAEGSAKRIFSATENDDFPWSKIYSVGNLKQNSYNAQNDIIVDRIKGFIYCYLIGANQSVSAEIGKLKAISRKLRNILSAVVYSPEKRSTQMQDDDISSIIKEFNEIYSSIDEDYISNKELLERKLADNPLGLSATDAQKMLRHFDVYNDFCSKLPLKTTYDAKEIWTFLESFTLESLNSITENMSNAIYKLATKEIQGRRKSNIKSLLSVEKDHSIHILDDSYNHKFYQELINSQIKGEYKRIIEEKGVEEPLAIAFNGGRILKNMLGQEWETNPASDYTNSLLNHFQSNTSFDLFASESDVLISFAAFCQKGDNIDRLVEYLEQTGFCNYKLVFGIYGATRGFASLPKTFTSSLINGGKDYYSTVARDVWLLLNGINLQNVTLPKQDTATFVPVNSQLSTIIIGNINKVEPNAAKQKKVINAVNEAAALEDAVHNPKAFMFIADNVLGKRTKAYKALKDAHFADDRVKYATAKEFRDKIIEIVTPSLPQKNSEEAIQKIDKAIELEANRNNREAFMLILDNFLKPTDAAYRNIAALLDIQYEEDNNQSNISDAPNGSDFVFDDNCWSLIKCYIPENLIDAAYEDLQWFQNEYKKGGHSKYYAQASRENINTIDAYVRYLRKKKYSRYIDIDKIGNSLKKIYVRKNSHNE